MDITRNLLQRLDNTKVMAGAASMQGILKELGMTRTGKPAGGSGIMIAKELSAFYVNDPSTIPILTDLYDYHPKYEKFLASQDIPPIKDVCLSLLAGSNEIMMRSLIDGVATEGGLLGRMIVISETRKRKSNSGFEDNQKIVTDDDWNPMHSFLLKLSRVKGPIIFAEQARKFYNDWYHSLEDKKWITKTGYEHRIHTHVIKLATILSAANSDWDKIIELRELEEAIAKCGSIMQTYKRLTMGAGRSPQAQPMSLILLTILDSANHQISRRDLLVKLYGEVDSQTLDESLVTLVQTEFIEEKSVDGSGTPGYKATKRFLDSMLEKQKSATGMVQ